MLLRVEDRIWKSFYGLISLGFVCVVVYGCESLCGLKVVSVV